MKIEQNVWTESKGWRTKPIGKFDRNAQLVLLFGSTSTLKEKNPLDEIRRCYPQAHLSGCSTAGEIYDTQVLDEALVTTAIEFESMKPEIAFSQGSIWPGHCLKKT